jgi:lysophospholipase L1-like esterase
MKRSSITFVLFVAACLFSCTKKEQDNHLPAVSEQTAGVSFAALDVGINDPNIKYFGRWDFSSSTQYVSYWGGAYFKVKFSGTTVKVKVGNTSNFYAKIDNGPWTSYIGASGTINLTPTALASGTHSLSVAQGKDYDYVFNFQGLILDSGASTSLPSVGASLIEYIGDSITTGYTDPQANVNDYGWVCAEALGTEHTQIAYPGICLTSGFTTNPGLDAGYFRLKSPNYAVGVNPNWTFGTYTPKLVVINLGTNDNNKAVPDATFQSTYTTFLANIRAKFPNAQIFVMRTFINVKAAPTLAAVNARIAAGDTKVHYIDTNGWLTSADYTDGLHPSVAGHIKASNLLKPILQPYLGTTTSVYLDHADATTGWVSGNTLSINTTDKKEGSGSLQSVGSGTLEFQKTFTAVNTGATVANGSIDFWYYVSDASKFSASNQIEVGSGGTNDVSEYNWNIGTVVNGWNHITKTFSTAGSTGGTPNLSAINWFRIYHAKTAGITTKIDAIQIIH